MVHGLLDTAGRGDAGWGSGEGLMAGWGVGLSMTYGLLDAAGRGDAGWGSKVRVGNLLLMAYGLLDAAGRGNEGWCVW
jgi:hypothetical protein